MSSYLHWVAVVLLSIATPGDSKRYYEVTVNGNSEGAPCVFPFVYERHNYTDCTLINHLTLWCSTTDNYTRDGKWGECVDYDVCLDHETLSDPWRNVGFNFSSFPGFLMNDSNLKEGWYSVSGVGGDRIVYSCPSIILKDNTLRLSDASDPSPDFHLNTCEVVIDGVQHVDCGAGLVLYYLVPISETYITRHSSCSASSCGEQAHCGLLYGSCECDSGLSIADGFLPAGDLYGCLDSDLALREECKGNFTTECAVEFLNNVKNMKVQVLPKKIVEKYLNLVLASMNVLEKTTDQNLLVLYGNFILEAVEKLVSTLVRKTDTYISTSITLQALDVQVLVVGPNASLNETSQLNTSSGYMDIDLIGISKNNKGSAAVAFMSYANLSVMLKPSLFITTENTEKIMMSSVVSATLPKTNNTQLTSPVNFTLKHTQDVEPDSNLSCVYWNDTEWVVDGCSVIYTNKSHTTCSCVHLSTFAHIMQINPRESDPLLETLAEVAVAVGLVFLVLALFSLAFCQRDSRLTNTALINLCISLFLAQVLFLLTQNFLQYIKPFQLLCAVMAGVLHFLFLSAFVWMFIEAVLLFISVKNLTKIRSKKKEELRWPYLIVIGYVIPLVIVGVSVGLFPDGYGSDKCWIKREKDFQWSFLGPVCAILASNMVLFIVTVYMLKSALAGLNNEVSQFRQARILVFKAVLQVIIIGCSWILGLFTEMEIIFLILNSQQGTFIFFIHCVLNQEVRQQYRKWLSVLCSCLKSTTKTSDKKK